MRNDKVRQYKSSNPDKRKYYASLLFVVFVWGLDPLIMSSFYKYYSATMLTAIGAFFSMILFFCLSIKKINKLDRRYLKIAIPISLINSVACLLQKIGLQYTTPANYAFLEHISCVIVPITLWIVTKKRPSIFQCVASAVCILGCFILCGANLSGSSGGIGNLLCTASGILLGVCVAAIGIYAKELDGTLYISIYMAAYFSVSAISAPILNLVTINGAPLEKLRFSFSLPIIVPAILFGLLTMGVCWLLKNAAIVHTDPTAVAVISPFSAVISGMSSVLVGLDTPSCELAVGGALIFLSILISGIKSKAKQAR